jgi:DNA-binding NtrC family response regulator
MATVFRTKLDALLAKFPLAEITVVRSFREAREKAFSFPFPDCIILDLTLLDYTWEETLRESDQLEERAPLIIVTGHPVEKVKAKLNNREIEVVPKTPETLEANFLIAAIARAINRRCERENKRLMENITVMREIIGFQDATAPTK